MSSIFIAHSRRDKILAPWFDRVFAREPRVGAVQFEFELVAVNPIQELYSRLQSSVALFVLLSPEVMITLQTSNWIAAETGLARGLGKPIWAFEPLSSPVKFPVPFVDHYVRLPIEHIDSPWDDRGAFGLVRGIIQDYIHGDPQEKLRRSAGRLKCPNVECQTVFQIYQNNHEIDRCPACCNSYPWPTAMMLCRECGGSGSGILGLGKCGNCGGQGCFHVDMGSDPCSTCQGQRVVSSQSRRKGGVRRVTEPMTCQACRGTGYTL